MIQDLLGFLDLRLFSEPPHHLKTQRVDSKILPLGKSGRAEAPGACWVQVLSRAADKTGEKTENDHLSLRRIKETSVAGLRFTPVMSAPVVSRENTTGGWK